MLWFSYFGDEVEEIDTEHVALDFHINLNLQYSLLIAIHSRKC